MKICVFGAGAVGGHIAAKLAASGHDVSVVARGAHLEAMRRNGITLRHGPQTIRGKVRAAASGKELGAQDVVIVALKANMLGAFALQCEPLLGPDTAVVFAQNGIPWWYDERLEKLDPGRRLARAVERRRILGGVVYSANEVIEPGVIENRVPGNNMLVIGEIDKEDRPRTLELRRALERADMASPPVEDIRQAIWSKLGQNFATSTLCTITGLTVAEIREGELGRIAQAAGEEARAIARGLGVDIERAPKRPSGKQDSGGIAHKPSMLQDYERGRPMEVESQLVAPLVLGRAAGVQAPTVGVLSALVAAQAAAKGLFTR